MKSLKLLTAAFFAAAALTTTVVAEEVEKVGFLTTKWCADNGMFTNCRLETVLCGYEGCLKEMDEFSTDVNGQIVLYVHSDGKAYNVKFPSTIKLSTILKEAINKNEVTLIGELANGTISVSEFEAPPPPKKEFFKGCL
ncbi:hypothetical protein [Arcobacter sp. FWKO B]|uniref:hypothetical protein n=1 Tax=Arcobacter sp. FWKO B TaxID=2593672 RepID=UPI0018A3C4C8|nr:hypothetical protein [Arcobacter sp. FWKO B]QOG12408.1 hypothetical protein FWKOB_06715 [Arcobacter sp. FWKO B]